MDESKSFTKQRKGALSRLDPNNKSRLSERDFVDNLVSPENELRRSGRIRTRRRTCNAISCTYKPF